MQRQTTAPHHVGAARIRRKHLRGSRWRSVCPQQQVIFMRSWSHQGRWEHSLVECLQPARELQSISAGANPTVSQLTENKLQPQLGALRSLDSAKYQLWAFQPCGRTAPRLDDGFCPTSDSASSTSCRQNACSRRSPNAACSGNIVSGAAAAASDMRLDRPAADARSTAFASLCATRARPSRGLPLSRLVSSITAADADEAAALPLPLIPSASAAAASSQYADMATRKESCAHTTHTNNNTDHFLVRTTNRPRI